MEEGKTYLLTLSDWFYAPDGITYRCVFGTYHGMSEDKNHLLIGNMRIKTYNIHTFFETEEYENGEVDHSEWGSGYSTIYKRPTAIYNADRLFTKLKLVEE